MQPQASHGEWDFSPAINFIRSQLAKHDSHPQRQIHSKAEAQYRGTLGIVENANGSEAELSHVSLGSFDAIFSALQLSSTSCSPLPFLIAAKANVTELSLKTSRERSANESRGKRTRTDSCLTTGQHSHVTHSLLNCGDVNRKTACAAIKSKPGIVNAVLQTCDNENPNLQKFQLAEKDEGRRRAVIQNVVNLSILKGKNRFGAWHHNHKHLAPTSVGPLQQIPNTLSMHTFGDLDSISQKRAELVILLLQRFPNDRFYLTNLGSTPLLGPEDRNGVHIFVDISNILIGFHDAVKRQHGLAKHHRIAHEHLSFHSLSLILERGRPTTKRVVVGSDNVKSVREAQSIGYEINILERVVKVKDNTFIPKAHGLSSYFNVSSGSEGMQTIRLRKVEQGVDEILHLKMLESLLDTESPSTMVLATGDAAEAEYSGGFLRMLERALCRNWKVELVSFRENMSSAYKSPQWMSKWTSSFTIIELDDYIDTMRLS